MLFKLTKSDGRFLKNDASRLATTTWLRTPVLSDQAVITGSEEGIPGYELEETALTL